MLVLSCGDFYITMGCLRREKAKGHDARVWPISFFFFFLFLCVWATPRGAQGSPVVVQGTIWVPEIKLCQAECNAGVLPDVLSL